MKPIRSPKLRIVVLAAGFARRLGQSKALARVGGMSLLRRTLRVTAALSDGPVMVVMARRSSRLAFETRGYRVLWISNRRRDEGLASSVRCGIDRKGPWSGVLLLPVDLPFLRRRELTSLISRWRGHRRQVLARRIGSNGGIPLILPRRLKNQALMVRGDMGLRELLRGLPDAQHRWVEMPSAGFDVDTPQDLAAARRRLSSA